MKKVIASILQRSCRYSFIFISEELDVFSDEDYAVLPKPSYNHVIIDCSGLSYIDTYGAKALNQVF